MVNNPYLRNKLSTSLAFSAAAILLVLTTTTASPLVLFNLVPVQAQTNLSFRTPTPADGSDGCMGGDATLTFDAQGTPPSSSNPQRLDITSGTFTVTARDDAQKTYSRSFDGGSFTSDSGGGVEKFALIGTIDNVSNAANCSIEDITFSVGAPCSTSNDGDASNSVSITSHYVVQSQAPVFNNFNGIVECSSQGGGDTTTQSSSSSSSTTVTVTTTQDDSDGDGILDANDNCPNLPHTRCYKEGDTSLVIHNNNR